MGCACGSLHADASTQYRVAAQTSAQDAVARHAHVAASGSQAEAAAGGPRLVGVAPAAGASGAGVSAMARRRPGDTSPAANTNTVDVTSDTVNDFLAERRCAGPGEAETGPRFNAYARYLGIDPCGEQDLLWVARCALHAPLPEGWTQHLDGQGRVFFYDSRSSKSSWTHPLEQEHREVHAHLRRARLSQAFQTAAEQDVRARLVVLEPEAAAAVQDWTAHTDESGNPFYYSRSAHRSSWTDPRPAAKHRAVLWNAALDVLEGRAPQDTLTKVLPGLAEEQDDDLPLWLVTSSEAAKEDDAGNGRTGTRTDSWLSPRLLLAERAVECPVCYEPLYGAQPSVLQRVDNDRRLCAHYFCLRCAKRLGGSCPLCRARASGGCTARPLPSVEKAPRQWFRLVDHSGNQRLERDEVVRALEAVLPLDAERLRVALGVPPCQKKSLSEDSSNEPAPAQTTQTTTKEELDTLGWWSQWHPTAEDSVDDGISEEAFVAEGGLLQWIVEHVRELHRSEQKGRPPDLTAETLPAWFDFWASDPAQGLSRPELLRALMRTFNVSGVERQKVREIRGTIEHCYHLWAPAGNDRVTKEAFVKSPGGLGETLLSALSPSCPEEEHPRDLTAPTTAPPAFSSEIVGNKVSDLNEEKPAYAKSGSFLDLMQRLSRIRSASEESPAVVVIEENRVRA